jgi:methionyl-tRNA formyltransferase
MLRVVFLTSQPAGNAARIIHYLLRKMEGQIKVVGVVVDEGTKADRSRQVKRLKAWNKQGGAGYAAWRLYLHIRATLAGPKRDPYAVDVDMQGKHYDFPVFRVSNINAPESQQAIASVGADLGVSIGNRFIVKRIFSIPKQGMINLHHGKIPFFRGGPPAFWELYEGASTLSVSVHRIDSRIDHGELFAEDSIPILPTDDTRSLYARALTIDYKLVERVLGMFVSGNLSSIPVDFSLGKVNTLPTYRELRELRRRLGRKIDHTGYLASPLVEIPVEADREAEVVG